MALVHRDAALLAVGFLLVHVISLFFDVYAQLKLFDLLVPFGATYRPVWTGLGTLAVDLLIALIVTSLLRHRLGLRAWRVTHWLAYACWPIAFAHALGTGSDAGTWWLRALAGACLATVVAAVVWRLSTTELSTAEPSTAEPSTAEPSTTELSTSERKTVLSGGSR